MTGARMRRLGIDGRVGKLCIVQCGTVDGLVGFPIPECDVVL